MISVEKMEFCEKPRVLYVDEDWSVKPPAYGTIDKLMQSLKENGPLVAEGKMGPGAYTEAPFKLKDTVGGKEVYGWKANTSKEYPRSIQVILLGAKQTQTSGYVYFTLAKDITRDKNSLIRGYVPLDTDTKIYVMSYSNFLNRSLENLHPICPHGQWLCSVEVNSILDGGETQKKCKQVGQEIFDRYKNGDGGKSESGENAVKRICQAVKFLTNDGVVRNSHINFAWDGIGDTTWQWRR